jgi:hypothetical protein
MKKMLGILLTAATLVVFVPENASAADAFSTRGVVGANLTSLGRRPVPPLPIGSGKHPVPPVRIGRR